MWGVILKWLLRIIISWIVPIILAILLAPKGTWAPGMDFGTWFSQSADCVIGTPGCDLTNPSICWGCGLFGNLIDFFSQAIGKSFDFLASDLILLILFGTAIWFAWFTFSQMKIDGGVDGKKYLQTIIRRLGRVLIIIFLLGGFSGLTGTHWMRQAARGIIEPIFSIHTAIVTDILHIEDGYCPEATHDPKGILTGEVKSSLLCTMGVMNLRTTGGLQAGGNMMLYGQAFEGKITWLAGAYVFGTFLLFHLMIPFLLLDILLTIIIPLFFLPLILAGYAFADSSQLSGHLSMAINMIIKSAFKMIALAVAFVFIYTIYSEVGDRYYPAPRDNFSYIFPNNISAKSVQHTPGQIEQDFKACYALADDAFKRGDNFSANATLMRCAKKIPNLEDSSGWMVFLLLFGLIQITMPLFERIMRDIGGMVQGNQLGVGEKIYQGARNLFQKGIDLTKSFALKRFK
ncbi:MAG: hypothetical protein JW812_03515 [Alphaproteobacteria bacterium]|nr:hypothetical protein [Alphaproteobacteria bacterium]MBN2779773.1 hypothetical protein [Alphaproteobacteria bacterium]